MPQILSAQRIRFLRAAAIGLSFAALALVEIVLRLAGYGDDFALFVPTPDDTAYLMPNPDLIERYFADGMAPGLQIERNFVRRDKPDDGIRVFVQGGSSAAGFPYGNGASLAALLGYRLQQSFPERPVEVVDTAMSAVSSYVLLDLADEIIAHEPDAVLVYAGHNEFLGVLGSGSNYAGSGGRWLKRLTMRLDSLRLFQLMRNLALQLRLLVDEPIETDATTLMAAVARTREIPLDSELYRQGISDFHRNLSALVSRYRDAGIPVLVGTVVSNLRDQPPFISAGLADGLPAGVGDSIDRIRRAQFDPLTAAELDALEQFASEQASAELFFLAGSARAERGEHAQAYADFVLARDHDLLRFRAASDINHAIREVARASGAVLVDVESDFTRAAADGLVGHDLILEHLHPNAEGYFLLADAYYRAMAAAAIPETFEGVTDSAAARSELWILPAEDYFARAGVAELTADFPFTDRPASPQLPPVRTAADELGRAFFDGEISWIDMAEASRAALADAPIQQAVVSQRIADRLPMRADLAARAGRDWVAAGRPERARRYQSDRSE